MSLHPGTGRYNPAGNSDFTRKAEALALGIPASPIFVSEWWLAFTAFVGLNLLQSGLTRWCLMETLLRKLGAKPGC